jgi:hypothetical protein
MRKEEAAAEKEAPHGGDGDDSRGSADDAANAGAGRRRPGRRARRTVHRKGDIETSATVVERRAEGVETAPVGEPQVVAEPKVEERAEGVKVETQNEPTGAVETGPEHGGIPTAGADDSPLGCPGSSPDVSGRSPQPPAAAERPGAGPAGCEPGHPHPDGDHCQPSFKTDAAPASEAPAAEPKRPISPWIREYYTDERLAEMLARYRAETAERLRQQGCDEEALRWVWPDGPPEKPIPG